MNIRASIEIMRPINGMMGCLTVLIGLLNTRFSPQAIDLTPLIFLSCFFYFLIAGSGMIINDIYDLRIDKVNRPDRPIPRGDITVEQAKRLYMLILGLGIVMAIIHGLLADILIVNIVLAVFFGFTGWLYAAYGKKTGFPGNVIVSLSFPIGIIYGAIMNGYNIPAYIFFFYLTSFSLLMAREIIKGCEDIKGDEHEGVRTLAISLGVKRAVLISACFGCMAIIFFILPVFAPIINPRAFFVVMIPGTAVVIYAFALTLSGDLKKEKLKKISLLLKVGAFLGLFAFLVASINGH